MSSCLTTIIEMFNQANQIKLPLELIKMTLKKSQKVDKKIFFQQKYFLFPYEKEEREKYFNSLNNYVDQSIKRR